MTCKKWRTSAESAAAGIFAAVLFLLLLVPIASDFGGHDLYTSLAQLEVLWRNELDVVRQMEAKLHVNETVTKVMKE